MPSMRRLRAWLRDVPPYAVLAPLLPAVWIFAANATRLSVAHGAFATVALLLAYFAAREALRRLSAGHRMVDPSLALGFLVLTCPLYLYGREALVAPFVAACVAVLFAAWFREEPRRLLGTALTVLPLTMISVNALGLLTLQVYSQRAAIEAVARNARFHSVDGLSATRRETRDVYFLVFDRYARADQLRSVYGFDNEPFLDALRQRGFVVADRAYANYQRTTHSLVSALNFAYLDELDTEATRDSPDWVPLYALLDDTRVARFLKAQGYAFHFFGSWWEPTRTNSRADVVHNWYSAPEALRAIYEHSLVVRVARLAGIGRLDPRWMQCRRTQRMFSALSTLEDARPMFVFAHFLVPHPPFVHDESGRCMRVEEAAARSRARNYVGQVRYANEHMLRFVDRVLARPGPKPIIILQADERPWPERFARDEIARLGGDAGSVDWTRATPAELREKMAILGAYYLPDAAETVPPDSSPVNVFRRVLRGYFGVAIEPLADRHFVFENNRNLYRFHEVTDVLSAQTPARNP